MLPVIAHQNNLKLSIGGGGRPIVLPRQPVPLRLAPVQRVRVRYGPARITSKTLVPVRYAARSGPAHIAGHTTATLSLEASTGPAVIVAGPNRTVLTVRASLPDDDLEVLLLAVAAALWE
jgi:hypothetical protein